MKTIPVSIPHQKPYDVTIASGLLSRLPSYIPNNYTKTVIIEDTNIARLYAPILNTYTDIQQIIVPHGETAKNINTVQQIWCELLRAQCDRKMLVVNIGGGVISDMGGFASSTYMRGIDFITVPTTLLSMVDASVGGKTGIDFDGVKNIIGTFTQPQAVLIDPNVLETLPDREFISGFAEIIKHGLIADRAYFEQVTVKRPREFSAEELEDIIAGSVTIKKNIVEQDPTETGLRKVLNAGHTIGHAIESYSHTTDRPLSHGEAIAIGLVKESQLAVGKGMMRDEDMNIIAEALTHAGLPTEYPVNKETTEALKTCMRHDKKNSGGKILFSLLKSIGDATYDVAISEDEITSVLLFSTAS